MFQGKKVLIGITGSIAAYKTIFLIRLLIKAGAKVKVVITDAAKNFVSPLVLSTLSKNKVVESLSEDNEWNNHVALGRWADVMLISPLSCNTLAKMAAGQCDNLLMAVYLSATCPVVVAPAMDEDMWKHASTKRNIATLKNDGVKIINVENGELASGLIGEGRMAEPEEIFYYLAENYFRKMDFKRKRILVSAGPTYESIDPVRFIGNYSSGKMGFAIANAFFENGGDVTLITGPTHEKLNYSGIRRVDIKSAEDMFNACRQNDDADVIVMSAAVADFKPMAAAPEKIKKSGTVKNIELTPTTDILQYLGHRRKATQFIAGFALETNNEKRNALEKLAKKNINCIILNSLKEPGAGFGYDTNSVTIFDQTGELHLPNASKQKIAEQIVEYISSKIKS